MDVDLVIHEARRNHATTIGLAHSEPPPRAWHDGRFSTFVLRITQLHHNGSLLLKLEGKLLAPWAGELRALVPDNAEQARNTRLDLRDVSFVDAAGTQLLRELIARGVVIQSTSSFVDQVLHVSREA